MKANTGGSRRPHYHISWEQKSSLDWECFDTHSEAISRAVELAGPEEKFTIEEVSEQCPLRKSNIARTGGNLEPVRTPDK
jgi:hypothetical protein